MKDFTILSIDIGSTFGYAYGKNGVIYRHGEVSLSAKDSHPGHRWLRFRQWLIENAQGVDEIIYEDVTGFRSGNAAKAHGALLSQLHIFTLQYGIRMACLPAAAVKKDFTGNGSAPKEMMCEVAMNLGWKNGQRGTRERNDECDAVALLWVVYSRRLIQPSFAAAA